MKQKYLEVGRMMKAYEDMKYEQWRDTTEQVLPALMKKSLLAKVRIVPGLVAGEATASIIPLRFDLLTLICKIEGSTGQRLAGRRGGQKGKGWGQRPSQERPEGAAPPVP